MYFFMAVTSLLLYRQHLHDHFAVHHCFHFQQINALQTRFPDIFCANINGDALRIPKTAGKTKGSFEKKQPKQWTNHKGNPSPKWFHTNLASSLDPLRFIGIGTTWATQKKTIRFFCFSCQGRSTTLTLPELQYYSNSTKSKCFNNFSQLLPKD